DTLMIYERKTNDFDFQMENRIIDALKKVLESLGGSENLESVLRAKLSSLEALVIQAPEQRDTWIAMCHLRRRLGQLLQEGGNPEEAQQVLQGVLRAIQHSSQDVPADSSLHREEALTHRLLGQLMQRLEKSADAEDHYRSALNRYDTLGQAE